MMTPRDSGIPQVDHGGATMTKELAELLAEAERLDAAATPGPLPQQDGRALTPATGGKP